MCIYGNLVRIVHIQNRMSIDCFCPLFKILANFCFGLKQNAFLRRWIFPHQHRKYKTFILQSMLFWNIISSIIRKWKLFQKARKESHTTLSRLFFFYKLSFQSRNRRNSHYLNFGYIPYQIVFFE